MRKAFPLLTILLLCSLTAHAERLYLSGTGPDDTRTWDFFCSAGQHSGRWSKIQVPSCWEQQGFGAYTYGRFYKKQGAQPSSESGRYRTTFRAPKEWRGRSESPLPAPQRGTGRAPAPFPAGKEAKEQRDTRGKMGLV